MQAKRCMDVSRIVVFLPSTCTVVVMAEKGSRPLKVSVADSSDSNSSDDGSCGSSSRESSISSIALNQLPAAPGAETARKRRSFVRSGEDPEEAKRARVAGGKSTSTPRVGAHERVLEFSGEHMSVSAGKLYCNACNETVQTKHSIVKAHVTSSTHKAGKERKAKALVHQATLTASWKKYSSEHKDDLAGIGLSKAVQDDVIVKRANVVEAFLKAGIPLSKIDYLRPILESGYGRLTFSTHMAQLIPFLAN